MPDHKPERSAKTEAALAIARVHRATIVARLNEEDYDNGDLLSKLSSCGETLTLICSCCRQPRHCEKRCRKKWCPVCARSSAARASARYAAAIAHMQWPIFVTFTVKNYDTLEGHEVKELLRAFKKLRRLRWFKRCVRGGVASIEVTNIGNGWHPHGHMVVDCPWFAVAVPAPGRNLTREQKLKRFKAAAKEVNEQWDLCLGRKGGVKIKRAYGEATGSNQPIGMEVLKYSVKGSDLASCKEDITPLIRQLDASRLVVSWGTLYGKKLLRSENDRPPMECEFCQSQAWVPKDQWEAQQRRDRRR